MTQPRPPLPSTSYTRYWRADCSTGKPRWNVLTIYSDDPADAERVQPITVPGDRCPDGSHPWDWVKTTEADYMAGQLKTGR